MPVTKMALNRLNRNFNVETLILKYSSFYISKVDLWSIPSLLVSSSYFEFIFQWWFSFFNVIKSSSSFQNFERLFYFKNYAYDFGGSLRGWVIRSTKVTWYDREMKRMCSMTTNSLWSTIAKYLCDYMHKTHKIRKSDNCWWSLVIKRWAIYKYKNAYE